MGSSLVKVFLFKEHTLSPWAVEQSNYELPDISDLLTTHTMVASKPQGILAKQTTGAARLLSNDWTDLLFIIHASSSHDQDQTLVITLTMCGVHVKSWVLLFFFVCIFDHALLCQVVKCVHHYSQYWAQCFNMKGLYTWCMFFVWLFFWPNDLKEMVTLFIVDDWDKVVSDSLTTPSDQYGMVLYDNKWLSWGTHSRKWKPIHPLWNNRIQSFFSPGQTSTLFFKE